MSICHAAERGDVSWFWGRDIRQLRSQLWTEIRRPPIKPMIEAVPQSRHHGVWNPELRGVGDWSVPLMGDADAELHESAGLSAVAVAEEPDIRRDVRVREVGDEVRAYLDGGHGFGEAPEVLWGEVVPVVGDLWTG